jgi:hypothetical protein
MMAVVDGGDAAEGKCNNRFEDTTAMFGTMEAAIDGGEARVKGKMSGWWTIQGNRVAEDAMRGEGGQRESIGRWSMQQEGGADNMRQLSGRRRNERGGRTTQGDCVVNEDTKREEGQTWRTQCSGRQHNKREGWTTHGT